jgi:hypothetical protein
VNVCARWGLWGGLAAPVGRRFGDRVASDASMVSPRQHRVCIATEAVARREGRTIQFTFIAHTLLDFRRTGGLSRVAAEMPNFCMGLVGWSTF